MVDVLERIDVEERIVGLLFEIISYLDEGGAADYGLLVGHLPDPPNQHGDDHSEGQV